MKYAHWWHANVIRVIKTYPYLRLLKDTEQAQSTTASYSDEPRGGSGNARKTENAALRGLSPAEEEAIEAVERALEKVSLWRDGERSLELIKAYYFRQDGKLLECAERLYISERQARRKNAAFLLYVAENLRLITKDGLSGQK